MPGRRLENFYTEGGLDLLARLTKSAPGSRTATDVRFHCLIKAGREVAPITSLYGQELNGSTWALAMMNMLPTVSTAPRSAGATRCANPGRRAMR